MAVSVEEAFARIESLTIRHHTEIIPIESAPGRILAEPLIATHDLPPFDNSAMDGFAVVCGDAGGCVTSIQTLLAGDAEQPTVTSGSAVRIMTGARIPEGTECIVPVEMTTQEQAGIRLPETLKSGQHIRRRGEDIGRGERLLEAGLRLQAHHITLLASQGVSHVSVYRQPRVTLFASGSELKMHFEPLQPHQIYNTNTPTLVARAQELGAQVHFVGTAADSLEALHTHIESALQSDLIITSGGVSVGDADYTREAFAHYGFEALFDKIDIKPGKPTMVGRIGDTCVLNLPGNPLAAALNFELFGKALIWKLSGASSRHLGTVTTTLGAPLHIKPGRRTLVPGIFDGGTFMPLSKYAPGMIKPLAVADAFVMISESCSELEAGARVKVIPTRFTWSRETPESLITLC